LEVIFGKGMEQKLRAKWKAKNNVMS